MLQTRIEGALEAGADSVTNHDMLWLTVIYCVTHFGLLLTTGTFADTWAHSHGDPHINVDMFLVTGRPPVGHLFNIVFMLADIIPLRMWAFAAYLGAGLLLYGVLKTIKEMDATARFCVTLLFMVYPTDFWRIAICALSYIPFYFLFFLAFWLTARYFDTLRLSYRLFALFVFFTSFWLHSLLVFYALVPLYILYRRREDVKKIGSLVLIAVRYPDFLCLPIIFWIMARCWYRPRGLVFEGYNQITFGFLSLKNWADAFKGSLFFDPLWYAITPTSVSYCVIVILLICAFYAALSRLRLRLTKNSQYDGIFAVIGAIALVLALFPYLAVGKVPTVWRWESRFALAAPFGASMILFYGIRLAAAKFRVHASRVLLLYCFIIGVCIGGHYKNYLAWWTDWYKCLAMVEEYRNSDIMRNHTSFLIKDLANDFNARRRRYMIHDHTGLLNLAFGDERRFALSHKYWTPRVHYNHVHPLTAPQRLVGYDLPKAWKLRDWKPKLPEYVVTVTPLREKWSMWELIYLKYLELTNPTAFLSELRNVLTLQCAPSILGRN